MRGCKEAGELDSRCRHQGFFDHVSHEWLMKFVGHRVADNRMLRLIQKWLKAGVSEDGQWSETNVGTPQGAVVSPLLANVYLHYVFDLWVEVWREKVARGDMIVVRYADDLVAGFQHRADAERFLKNFQERLAKFELEIQPEKTRLMEFGRFAASDRRKRGEGKPATFTFLGFMHFCGTNSTGRFVVWRHTSVKRMREKLMVVSKIRTLPRSLQNPQCEIAMTAMLDPTTYLFRVGCSFSVQRACHCGRLVPADRIEPDPEC